jgi:hypothetical protein
MYRVYFHPNEACCSNIVPFDSFQLATEREHMIDGDCAFVEKDKKRIPVMVISTGKTVRLVGEQIDLLAKFVKGKGWFCE